MRINEAMIKLAFHGLVLKNYDGDYCVNYKHGSGATAYYTSDIEDAVERGVAMAREREQKVVGRRNKALEQQVQS